MRWRRHVRKRLQADGSRIVESKFEPCSGIMGDGNSRQTFDTASLASQLVVMIKVRHLRCEPQLHAVTSVSRRACHWPPLPAPSAHKGAGRGALFQATRRGAPSPHRGPPSACGARTATATAGGPSFRAPRTRPGWGQRGMGVDVHACVFVCASLCLCVCVCELSRFRKRSGRGKEALVVSMLLYMCIYIYVNVHVLMPRRQWLYFGDRRSASPLMECAGLLSGPIGGYCAGG